MTTLTGLTSSTLHKALRKKDIRINDTRINEDTIILQTLSSHVDVQSLKPH